MLSQPDDWWTQDREDVMGVEAASPEWHPSRAWPTLALLLAFGAGMAVQHCVEAESVPRVAEEPVR